jgi:hypothetical protein
MGADEDPVAESVESAESALPAAIELAVPPTAVAWSWIVPAGARGDEGEGEGEGEAESLAEFRPPGAAPMRLGTIRFQYDGEAPADALRIVGTVPADLEYVDGSATGPGAETEYDADGRRITWTIAGPLDPGTRGLVSFRAVPRGSRDAAPTEAP